ncbi:MAG TPA: substrate-binding domain-containing protein, partial [Chloroflexota bacterium]
MPASNRVRQQRLVIGLSQQALAEQVGLARQAVHAIESGRYLPNTSVALRLARVLHSSVEALFALPDAPLRIAAELPALAWMTPGPQRVQVARVGTRTMAYPLHGSAGAFTAADGLATVSAPAVAVDLLVRLPAQQETIVVGGCDPALAILGAHLRRQHAPVRLIWWQGNSMAALLALARGEVHAAGIHLRDPHTGVSNLPFISQELAGRSIAVVALCDWQQGLLLAPGNPKRIARPADLARPDVTITNRAHGAGSRLFLDAWLAGDAVPPAQVRGYGRSLASHFA